MNKEPITYNETEREQEVRAKALEILRLLEGYRGSEAHDVLLKALVLLEDDCYIYVDKSP